jgi:hypothetical protein
LAGAAAAAATLLQEARLRFWWFFIYRSIFFGLQTKLRLLDFTYVVPWRARRLKPCWVCGSSSSAKRRRRTRSKWKEEVGKQRRGKE